MTQEQNDKPETPPQPPSFAGPERRRTQAVFDEHGHVHTPTYSGPDRRAHQRKQEQMVKVEKKKFMNRTIMTCSVFTVLISYAGIVLLAPEIAAIKKRETELEHVKTPPPKPVPAKPQASIGGQLNSAIETVQDTTKAVAAAIPAADATPETESTLNITGLNSVPGATQILGAVAAFNRMVTSPEGQSSAANAIDSIKSALFAAGGDPQQTMAALDKVRRADPSVAAVLGQVNSTDLKAAALLLTLNEFRSNVGSSRAFETDLAVLQKYAGNDPQLQAALVKLAPYAKSGVLSREGLQKALEATAGDIVMAKMRGEDASAKERIMARFSNMVKIRRVDDVTGDTPDAIVARAQKLLSQGDVKTAVRELHKLDGASAAAAAPFIAEAEGTMAAEEASGLMTDQVMEELSATLGTSLQGLFQPDSSLYISPAPRKSTSGGGGFSSFKAN